VGAAKLQPESQKLPWRIQATPHDRNFHRKIRRTEGESGGFALPPPVWSALRAEWRGEQSDLLLF
jgi:hypothetical protein